jgi:protein tyrosine phosphatase (PTP) superfamily phosphohydrolase (DUF442 family)
MPAWVRGALAAAVVVLVVGVPSAAFRVQYVHAKRFREVTPGRFYRSGQMTAAGFREVLRRYGIRTVINLQHEEPDPHLADGWLGKRYVREQELCGQLGVAYHLITPDILPEPNRLDKQPPAVADFLKILDDETAYPVLIHCKAGLHRTGRLTAIYRMEYEGWAVGAAMRELRANGYGFVMSSEADDFVIQFIENYKPRTAAEREAARTAAGKARQASAAGGTP